MHFLPRTRYKKFNILSVVIVPFANVGEQPEPEILFLVFAILAFAFVLLIT